MVKVMFVCLGNICRSTMAMMVFRSKVSQGGHDDVIVEVTSSGTAGYHIGDPPDHRTLKVCAERLTDFERAYGGHTGQQLSRAHFEKFDYIVAMDRDNLNNIKRIAPAGHRARVSMFSEFDTDKNGRGRDVDDPYYGGIEGFEDIFVQIDRCADGLLQRILANNN
eukprot:comp7792_c0_seq1/m.8026 comp7792_c0_seq1/g.8026  ORF comp7792_c0_seq1/g.8026 comp7792_c0_seq1/m.8026 type:complete len:165 (-) comp7792_c0_seq1:11-505(-)